MQGWGKDMGKARVVNVRARSVGKKHGWARRGRDKVFHCFSLWPLWPLLSSFLLFLPSFFTLHLPLIVSFYQSLINSRSPILVLVLQVFSLISSEGYPSLTLRIRFSIPTFYLRFYYSMKTVVLVIVGMENCEFLSSILNPFPLVSSSNSAAQRC